MQKCVVLPALLACQASKKRCTACGSVFWPAMRRADGLDIKIAGAPMPQSINYLPLTFGGALICVFALYKAWLATQPAPKEGV